MKKTRCGIIVLIMTIGLFAIQQRSFFYTLVIDVINVKNNIIESVTDGIALPSYKASQLMEYIADKSDNKIMNIVDRASLVISDIFDETIQLLEKLSSISPFINQLPTTNKEGPIIELYEKKKGLSVETAHMFAWDGCFFTSLFNVNIHNNCTTRVIEEFSYDHYPSYNKIINMAFQGMTCLVKNEGFMRDIEENRLNNIAELLRQIDYTHFLRTMETNKDKEWTAFIDDKEIVIDKPHVIRNCLGKNGPIHQYLVSLKKTILPFAKEMEENLKNAYQDVFDLHRQEMRNAIRNVLNQCEELVSLGMASKKSRLTNILKFIQSDAYKHLEQKYVVRTNLVKFSKPPKVKEWSYVFCDDVLCDNVL